MHIGIFVFSAPRKSNVKLQAITYSCTCCQAKIKLLVGDDVLFLLFVVELEEVNEKLREVNQQLNEQLSLTVDAHHADSRKKVYAESQKIIEEMQ